MLGIMLSIIFPGLGQLYHKQYSKGFVMILLGITPMYPLALFWSIAGTVKKAKESGAIDKKTIKWFFISVFIIAPVFISCILFTTKTLVANFYDNTLYPKHTNKELLEIKTELEIYKSKNNRYPENFYFLLEKYPTKKIDWQLDAWGNPYKVIWEINNVMIISSGKDGIFDTKDDIKME